MNDTQRIQITVKYSKEFEPWPRIVIGIITASCCIFNSQAVFAQVTTKVSEVKGEFCRASYPPGISIKSGEQGKLLRTDDISIGASIVVTVTKPDYFVAKVTGTVPRVYDILLFPAAEKPKSKGILWLEQMVGQKVRVTLLSGEIHADAIVKNVNLINGLLRSVRIETQDGETLDVKSTSLASIVGPDSFTFTIQHSATSKVWDQATDEQHVVALAELKEMVTRIEKSFSKMKLYETERYLFCSNLPPAHIGPYVQQLDRMHRLMKSMYRIPPEQRVWLGKALIVAFASKKQFQRFERTFMEHTDVGSAHGFCHQKNDGKVIVSCYDSGIAGSFGPTLVHEASHGFVWRYKSRVIIPSWIDEGLAEYVAERIVPTSQSLRLKEIQGLQSIARSRKLFGLLGDGQSTFRLDHYGIAKLAVRFLIRLNSDKFKLLIDELKSGKTYQESLMRSYGVTPEQMVKAFGQSLGIPNLKP